MLPCRLSDSTRPSRRPLRVFMLFSIACLLPTCMGSSTTFRTRIFEHRNRSPFLENNNVSLLQEDSLQLSLTSQNHSAFQNLKCRPDSNFRQLRSKEGISQDLRTAISSHPLKYLNTAERRTLNLIFLQNKQASLKRASSCPHMLWHPELLLGISYTLSFGPEQDALLGLIPD